MRLKTTWMLIAVFAALAAYLSFVENPRYEARQEAEAKAGLLFEGFDPDAVTELALSGKRGAVRVTKGDEDRWRVVEPWDDRADDGAVRGILDDLKRLKADKEVAGPDADLAAFGLDAPEVAVETQGAAVRLAVGAETPTGGSRYVRAGDGPVKVAPASSVMGLLREPEALRNKDVLEGYPWSRLAAVEVRSAGAEPIRLVKEGESWRLEQPFAAEADPDAAERVADKLRWARIERFLDGDEAAEKARAAWAQGLAVTLEAEGQADPVTVRLAEVDGAIWAERSGRNALFTVHRDVWEAFRVSADDLRRRKPVLAKAWKLRSCTLAEGETSWTYEKADGAWKRGDGALEDPEKKALEAFLRALEEERAEEVVASPGPPADYGLDRPGFRVTVSDGDSEQILLLGKAGEVVYARAGEAGPVYRMPESYWERAKALAEAAGKTGG
ncbi:MAG: hypothetical protein Kow0092_32730 [Deferrisomatales bacterium]